MAKSIENLVEVTSRPDSVRRAAAVAAALEVISSTASQSSDPNQLTFYMENLSTYADQIQKALNSK